MWEKSRFLNATASSSAPSWANDTTNQISFFQNPFIPENYPAGVVYPNGDYSTISPYSDGIGGACQMDNPEIATSLSEIMALVGMTYTYADSDMVYLNQWFELDISGCFDVEGITNQEERPLVSWNGEIFVKIIGGFSWFNFKPFYKVGFYYNGMLYENITELVELWASENGVPFNPNTQLITNLGFRQDTPLIPIFKDNGNAIQTVQELENYINPGSPASVLETIASEDTMPDLGQLTTAFQTELQEKGSALTTSNETVTSLLGDYFDAVDFATATLNEKSADLNTALALCNSGSSGACSDVGELTTTVNTLRSDLEALESEDAIKTAIEGALDDIAQYGTTNATNLGDASGDIGAIQQQLSDRQASIDSLNAEITSKNSQISSLETSLASSEGDVSDLTAELSSQYENLTSQISAKGDEILGLESDLLEATETIADNDAEIEAKANTISSLNNELNDANSDYAVLQSAKAQVDAEIISLTSTNTGLTNEIGDLEIEISGLNSDKFSLQADIIQLQSEATDNTQEIAQRVAEIQGLNAEISTLTAQRNNLQDGFDYQSGLATERAQQIVTLNAEVSSLETERDNLQDANTSLGNEVNSLTSEIAQKESQISSLQSQGAIDTSTITQLEGERDGLVSDLAQVNAEKQQLNDDISGLNDDVLELQGEKAQLQLDIAAEVNVSAGLQTELTEKIAEVQGLEANLFTEQQEKLALESQISDAEADFATLEAFLVSETESTNALGSQIQSEINALQGALSQFGYTPPTQENFSGFSGMNFVDLVKEAGEMRKQYLNFRGKVVQNDMNKSRVMNNKLNFNKPKSRVKFRADGGESFEKKYGTLGKIGLIGGLLYLITKK